MILDQRLSGSKHGIGLPSSLSSTHSCKQPGVLPHCGNDESSVGEGGPLLGRSSSLPLSCPAPGEHPAGAVRLWQQEEMKGRYARRAKHIWYKQFSF